MPKQVQMVAKRKPSGWEGAVIINGKFEEAAKGAEHITDSFTQVLSAALSGEVGTEVAVSVSVEVPDVASE